MSEVTWRQAFPVGSSREDQVRLNNSSLGMKLWKNPSSVCPLITGVNKRSLLPVQYQQVSEYKRIYSVKTAQLWYTSIVKQLSWGGSCKETQVKQLRGGGLDVTSQFANLWNASKALHWDRGEELAYVERSSYPWPLIGPFLCKWRIQILTVWLFQRALSWLVGFAGSDWSAKMQMEIQLHSSGRIGQVFSPFMEFWS